MWVLLESYHDVTYFTPESRAATDSLGCKGGWMGYFGMRAAPLGAVPPELVISTFYNFHPWMVRRAIPDAWQVASPKQFLATRLAGAEAALRRMLGDALDTLDEAADLAVTAAKNAPIAGRPLGAANAALPSPSSPAMALWQAATVLRESRGDGHVAALVAASLDPIETLVLFAAERGLRPEYMRQARGWSEEEWTAAADRLTERGLLSPDGITEAGTALRNDVEDRTDALASTPWDGLGPDRTDRLAELLTPLVQSLADQNDAMRANPMALDVRAALARARMDT
ncbi:hypothetical protein EV192_106763 [Actinocrispum wychmicini]|uniref:SalK n=2 Tax=Actinocrispum wychmicini TaxID=1213861 RepID=A0A4R2JJT4_9PSEU|nr:hypothetical protein EV192_106763 [Actinocrispum wychmicini]